MSLEPYADPRSLVEALPSGDGLVGLDLEADSLYRYAERICLMQVCYEDEVALVDPLAGRPLDALVDFIKGNGIWMHGADYDISLMLQEWQITPAFIYDTQVAAQLVGDTRFGYASLVEQYFGVELSKSSQKADWGRRPLSDKMLEYAKNDVVYLLPLAAKLTEKLEDLGRHDWFLESCEVAMSRVVAREAEKVDPWRVNGSGRLQPSGLRFLKAMWDWRDLEAKAWNKPTFMVATNKQLLAWATDLAEGKRIELPPRLRPDRRRRLQEALKLAQSLPKESWPDRPKRIRHKFDSTFEDRLKKVMAHRNEVAMGLQLEPALLASRSVLEEIVGGRAEPSAVLMTWQQALLQL